MLRKALLSKDLGTPGGSRTSAFGLYDRPLDTLVRDVRKALGAITHERNLVRVNPTRKFPLKRLRNNLCDAMALAVVMQPTAAVKKHTSPNVLNNGKHAKQTVVWNPVWDMAPRGAYRKARRLCSLFTDLCLGYDTRNNKTAHLLERLSIHVWSVSMRHFDGMLRAIRSTLWKTFEKVNSPVKNPEALALLKQLTNNPLYKREQRWNSHRKCRHIVGYSSMRSSHKLGCVRESYKCTKCKYAACAAKWFTTTIWIS